MYICYNILLIMILFQSRLLQIRKYATYSRYVKLRELMLIHFLINLVLPFAHNQ